MHVIGRLYSKKMPLPSPIGGGSAAYVFNVNYLNKCYAVKKFSDMARWKRETQFLNYIEKYDFDMIPTVFLIAKNKEFIVFEKIEQTLKTWLDNKYAKMEKQGAATEEDNSEIRSVLLDIFNGLFLFHSKGVVHGDIHKPNIMIDQKEKKVYFIDFGDSLISTDFTIDLLRLKCKILDDLEKHKINWIKLVKDVNNEDANEKKLINVAAFDALLKVYSSRTVKYLFQFSDRFLAPGVQIWVYRILKIFTNLDYRLDEYKKAIQNQPISSGSLINVAAFNSLIKTSCSRSVNCLFEFKDKFLAPAVQAWASRIFKIFTNLNYRLDKYKKAIQRQTSSSKSLLNAASFNSLVKTSCSRSVDCLFEFKDKFLAPTVQGLVSWIFKIFTNLDSLVNEYKKAIQNQTSSSRS